MKKIVALMLLVVLTQPLVFAQKHRSLTQDQRIIHVLNRLGFGARPGDVERVKAMGVEKYIEQQLHPEQIADSSAEAKLRELSVLNMTTAELYEKYPQPGQLLRQLQARGMVPEEMPADAAKNPLENEKNRKVIEEYYRENGLQRPQRIIAELQASRILRAVYSERQLQEVMVDFWTNHFNIFANKGADRWLLPAYDRDTIRPNAMGKFSTLLQATAQSPAMLFYLDNFQSVSPNANQGRRGGLLQQLRPQQQPPQRQRRGINENYARELMELHTLGVDGGYTQKDVQEVARCFTGWTIFQPRGGAAAVNAMMGEAGRRNPGTFFFNARVHDDGEKTVLGHKIPSGGGIKDGLTVLDILAHHPSTAKFIATKLVRHFVSDTPPQSLVDRVAATFTKSDGDIRETLKAIFFSKEFNSTEAYRVKIKRPFELVISAIRTLGADTNGGPGTHRWIERMGEPLYGFQTPNGYSDAAESWVNTGGLLERMNFGLALANNRVQGTTVNLSQTNGAQAKVMDEYLKTLLAGDISAATREALLKQLEPSDPATKVVGLILGTPEFQRQ
ncbi:MAG TPA: DUF1800 domain-containing protein [Pyrinomonadaceae bacterium]|nr:DUF1800 domain-containing protein [Pyrinomonadaceae bacterium]